MKIAHVARKITQIIQDVWLSEFGIGLRENNHIVSAKQSWCYLQHKRNLLISRARDHNNNQF